MYQPIIDIIKNGERFLVASHAHPDGDGIGSTIALAKGIEGMGKKAVMFNADPVPQNLRFLPYSGEIVQKIGANDKFDAILMVDCANIERIGGDVAKLPAEALGKKVLIDHHRINFGGFDIVCIDESAAAAGEVVYRILKFAGTKITKEMATILFCTFVVDTGSFRYSNTSASLLKDAAELVEAGASSWEISKHMDESNPVSLIKLLPMVLATFERSGSMASVVLTQQMLDDAGAGVDVAEEFINYPRSIQGVEVAMLFRELKNNKWKVSFRSKDDIDVYQIASKFEGGGHSHAAGCTLEGSLAEVKMKIFEEVRKNLNNQ